MEVLVERIEDVNNEILVEESTKEKRYIIEGICIQTNIKNRNGRIYPKAVVAREVDRYIREEVNSNKAVGELNHPTSDPRINYERVSHKFEKLTESGDNWIGRAVVTKNTPMGRIVAGLMDEGVTMGISSRALGKTVLSEGVRVVQNNFRLITPGDIVSDPSAPDAYLTNLMEGKEWVWENGLLVERESEVKGMVNKLSKHGRLDEQAMKRLFSHLINRSLGVRK